MLRDYGGKPVSLGNLQGTDSQTSLEYAFPEGGKAIHPGDLLQPQRGAAHQRGFPPAGRCGCPGSDDRRRQKPNSQDVLRLPTEVQAGIKLQQIVIIDQSNEIMTAVGTIKLAWQDPKLAFSPDECNCQVKEYTENNFNQFLTETGGDWPDFTFFNQQGNRWSLSRIVDVQPDGSVTYLERFSTNFQLNFDFSPYPFDTEDFYIHADMLYPEDRYVMVPMEGFSEIDPENGEDEFILTGFRYLGQQRDLQPDLPDLALHLPLQRPALQDVLPFPHLRPHPADHQRLVYHLLPEGLSPGASK